jgi:hypothetical protein
MGEKIFKTLCLFVCDPGAVGGVLGAAGFFLAAYFIYHRWCRTKTQVENVSGEAHGQDSDSTEQITNRMPFQPHFSGQVLEQPMYADNIPHFGFGSGVAVGQYPAPSFACSLPPGVIPGQVLYVQVPIGYSQVGQTISFTVPPGAWPGQVVNVPLPG